MSPKALDVPRPASQGGSTGGEAMMCDPYFRPPGSHRATGETSLHPKPLECGMKRLLVSLAAASLIVGLAAGPVAAAAGGVQRNQVTTTSYTVSVLDTYIHNYTVTTNPCDGTVAITGATPVASGYYTAETITGTLASGVIWFTSTYDGPYSPGYSYMGNFPVVR